MLPKAEFAYNNSRNVTTGLTPFMALVGYDPATEMTTSPPPVDVPAVTERVANLKRLRADIKASWKHAVEQQALYHRQRTKAKSYNVGDRVYLSGRNIRTRRPNKKLDYK